MTKKKYKKRYRVLIDPKYSEEYFMDAFSKNEAKKKAWERYLKKAIKRESVRIIVDEF